MNFNISLSTLRYIVVCGALLLLATSSSAIGLWLGLLSLLVPIAWLYALLWLTGNAVVPLAFSQSSVVLPHTKPDLMSIALCLCAAVLVAPVFVNLGEALNNVFGAMAGGNDLLTYFMLRVGVVEELLKFSAVVLVVLYLSPGAIRSPVDGIVLAWAASLGFAAYENTYHNLYIYDLMTYANEGGLSASAEHGSAFQVFLLGSFVRVPLHALYGTIWGAAFGMSRFMAAPQRYAVLLLGLASTIFLHGLWDTLAQSKTVLVYALMVAIYASCWYGCFKLYHRVKAIELVSGVSGENHE